MLTARPRMAEADAAGGSSGQAQGSCNSDGGGHRDRCAHAGEFLLSERVIGDNTVNGAKPGSGARQQARGLAGAEPPRRPAKPAQVEGQRRRGQRLHASSDAMGNRCALSQLADGRARAKISSDPVCTAKNGCPTEYAATNTGAVYDGNSIGPKGLKVLSMPPVPGLDDISGPRIPNNTPLRDYQREGDKIRNDAMRCTSAEQNPEYGVSARRVAFERVGRDLMALTNRGCQEYGNDTSFFSSLLCIVGFGDCDKRKDCKSMSQAYTVDCLRYDTLMAKAHAACPLNSEPYAHQNCHRFDPLGASSLSVPVANPKRIF